MTGERAHLRRASSGFGMDSGIHFLVKMADRIYSVAVLAFLTLPILVVMPTSFSPTKYLKFPPETWSLHWYDRYIHDADWLAATAFSLKVAVMTTATSLLLGMLASLVLVRSKIPGKPAIRTILLAPMIVPHIIIAVAMYMVYINWGLAGTTIGFVIAHTVVCTPFVVINVTAGLQKMDPSLELASLSLGATRLRAFRYITMPLLLPSLLTAGVFSFVTSLDEAVISYFLSGGLAKPLTRKMFEDIDFDLSPIIAVVSTLIVLLSILLMGGVEILRSKRSARMA